MPDTNKTTPIRPEPPAPANQKPEDTPLAVSFLSSSGEPCQLVICRASDVSAMSVDPGTSYWDPSLNCALMEVWIGNLARQNKSFRSVILEVAKRYV